MQKRLKELETIATSSTSRITFMPNGRGVCDKVEDYAAKISSYESGESVRKAKN